MADHQDPLKKKSSGSSLRALRLFINRSSYKASLVKLREPTHTLRNVVQASVLSASRSHTSELHTIETRDGLELKIHGEQHKYDFDIESEHNSALSDTASDLASASTLVTDSRSAVIELIDLL